LLSVFHYVCAGLAALFACFPIIHLILGLVFTFNPQSFGPPSNQPPAFIGMFLVAIASAMILLGWLFAASLAYAGRCLARRKNYTFCFVMAAIACLFLPFGTVLGVCSLVVLLRPSVKALFNPATPPSFTR
jgi:hypothetical protein